MSRAITGMRAKARGYKHGRLLAIACPNAETCATACKVGLRVA